MSLRRKLLAFLHNRKKTAEYTELAYLESTGTQWIDTGIAFQPIKAVIDVCFNSEKATRQAMGFSSNNTTYFAKTSGGLFELGGSVTLTDSNAYQWQEVIFEHNGVADVNSGSVGKITVGGKSISRTGTPGRPTTNFCLFNIPGYGTTLSCHCKISSAKFYNTDTNELIVDLIPVLDKDLKPCMYDKVSGTYLYNVGTGEFNWKLPNQLEYLESDGNQYLNLDYIPTDETGLHVKVSTVGQGDMIICGSRNDTNHTRLFLSSTYSSAARPVPFISIGRGTYMYLQLDGSFVSSVPDLTVPFNTVYEQYTNYKNSKVTRFIDSTRDVTSVTIPELTFTPNQPLYLFAGNIAGVTNYNYKGKIYFCEITEGDKIIMYLIPAFDENLNICMYDLVSKKYFYNQGTGSFKGYFADGSQLVGYLESTGVEYIDSGIECTSDLKVEFKGSCSTFVNAASCGGIDLTNNPIYVRHHWSPHTASITAGGHYSLNYWCQKNSAIDASVNPPYTLGDTVEVMIDAHNGLATVNGVDYSFEPLEDGLTTGRSYGIFARISNTGAIQSRPCKFWYFKIYKKDELARHLLPVVDSNGVACMYDVVTEKLFVNQGSGSFTYE